MARAYASADIFFFPSVTETFSIITLEAMSYGVHLVCANATGSSSLVSHDITGSLANPDDDAEYVRHLAMLIGDADLRLRVSKACVEHAHSYDWDTAMHSLLAHYYELVHAHGSVPESATPAGVSAPLTP